MKEVLCAKVPALVRQLQAERDAYREVIARTRNRELTMKEADAEVKCLLTGKAGGEEKDRESRKSSQWCQHDDPSWCTDGCPKREKKGAV